ncbi:MAG: Panacea domain-containing protein [Holosporales bacterium]|jgi:uncharacterized phage-associated protein
MIAASSIARYFLTFSVPEQESGITNLKLQKLLYYAQGLHLGTQKQPLFEDTMEAWRHGPVVPSVYQDYKHHGSGFIPRPDDVLETELPGHVRDLLNSVYAVYGQYEAWKLAEMTHNEAPWREAVNRAFNAPLSLAVMEDFFATESLRINGYTKDDVAPADPEFVAWWNSL